MVEINEKQIFDMIQRANEGSFLKIGVNETTKSIERGSAKLVVYANDVSPAEIVAHLPGLSKEMKVLCLNVGSKQEVGTACGIKSTAAVCILDGGLNKEIESLKKQFEDTSSSETSPSETKKEEKVEEKTEE